MGPDDKFVLVIKGGDVLDPSQSLRGKRDIGIRYGIVEAVEPEIPAARAMRVLDASGKLVTPGLVDLHAHVYPYGSAIGIPADELVGIGTRRPVSTAMPGPITLQGFAASSSRRPARASTPLYTSPMPGSRLSQLRSSRTLTSRMWAQQRKPSPKMPTL
jgi:hypothetical protein